MSALREAALCTQDDILRTRAEGALKLTCRVRMADSIKALERILQQTGPAVILLDLRAADALEFLAAERHRPSLHAVIALGEPRSDPALEAEAIGIYALEDIHFDPRRIKSQVQRAFEHLRISEENQLLRQEADRTARSGDTPAPPRPSRIDSPLPLRHFARAHRHFEKMDVMLERIVEGLAATVLASRAGIFVRTRGQASYRYRAGLRCLEDSHKLEFHESDDLVGWLNRHAHLVSRNALDHVNEPAERVMLRRALDTLGAEMLLPLHGRGGLLGWLFIGHRATGRPFDDTDLEDLTVTAEHIATSLENAMLYEEVSLQKSIAETLLHALPTGIIAADAQGIIRWFSTAAQNILLLPGDRVVNHPVEKLGSRLADVLRRTLAGEADEFPQAWTEPQSKRPLIVQSRRLADQTGCLGAVAIIQDLSAQRALEEKQEQLERAAFWNELAASMSHEIRNPLVAIKTFAQLLPERFDDADFRNDFSKLVSLEVDRLNGIIDQINDFAHPPTLKVEPVDIRKAIEKGIEETLPAGSRNGLRVATFFDDNIPPVLGDEQALKDSIGHLVRNAAEALDHKAGGEITISAQTVKNGNKRTDVMVTVKDNGPGIPPDMLDKVFSPFCTTKARGMGLGLPIVKRTVIDHNGHVDVASNNRGTSVTITLPTATNGR